MTKAVTWIVVLVLALIAVVIAIANRQIVLLSFDPFPWTVTLPLYLLLFAALLIGLIIGMAAEWWRGRRWRREARQRRREAQALTRERDALLAAAGKPAAPAPKPEILIPPA